MARGISSIVTTAVVAGTIGLGAGVYFVPNEKADQFRAMANEKADQFSTMVHGGLGAIYRVVYSNKPNADFHPSEPSQAKSPGETSRTGAQPDVPAGSQPSADAQCDPGDAKCRGGLPVDAAAPQAIPDRDVAAPSTPPEQDDQPSHALNADPPGTVPPGTSDREVAAPSTPPEQDDQPSHALNADPPGTVPSNSSPSIESDVPTPVAPETAKKKHPAKKVKSKSSPE